MVDDLIARMDSWLRENRADYYANLQPGASLESIEAIEKQFAVTLPEAFRKLYLWRDGQRTNESASLQDNRMFSSLKDIAETKEMLDGMIGYDFDNPKWWRRGWIPFLSNGGGDHLCLDLAAEDGGTVGQLIEFWHDDEDRDVEFVSLEIWLQSLVESMENGTLELA